MPCRWSHLFPILPIPWLLACGFDEKRQAKDEQDYFETEQSEDYYQELYTSESLSVLEQRYFYEMFLNRGYNGTGASGTSGGTARFTSDIMFWFKSAEETDGVVATQLWIEDGVERLTGGAIKALFTRGLIAPTTTLPVVSIEFRTGLPAIGLATFVDNSAGEITSGTIEFSSAFSSLLTFSDVQSFRTVVRHELGHVLAATVHSGMIANIMSYNKSSATAYNFQTYEINAFKKLYSLPPATKLATLQASGYASAENLNVGPRIDHAINITDPVGGYNRGKAGDLISIAGERLNFPWGCSEANFEWPTLQLNDVTLYVEFFVRSLGGEGASHNCAIFNFVLPAEARSGNLEVHAYGKISNSIPFTVE